MLNYLINKCIFVYIKVIIIIINCMILKYWKKFKMLRII